MMIDERKLSDYPEHRLCSETRSKLNEIEDRGGVAG